MENLSIFIAFIKSLYKSRYMIWTMAKTELKKRYIGSIFGFTWAVLYPLTQVAIYGVVFGVFFGAKPDPVYNTDNFFVFLICGLIPWQFFSQAASQSTNVIMSNTTLIKKAVGFHSEILPVITVITNIISHLIGIGLLLLILILFNGGLTLYVPVIFMYLFFISVFSVGLGWILSGLNVYMRDVQQLVGLLMMGWLYFTPIFYSPSIIPAALQPIWKLNPMYHVVVGYRHALLGNMLLPGWDLLYLACISFATFGLGGLIFRKLKPRFAEVL